MTIENSKSRPAGWLSRSLPGRLCGCPKSHMALFKQHRDRQSVLLYRWWPSCLFLICLVFLARRRAAPGGPARVDHVEAAPGSSFRKLDLVFTLDCTGSMGAYIAAAKDNVEAIVTRLVSANGQAYDLRFGIVGYRDLPPEENTWVTKVFPLTHSVEKTRAALAGLEARGGGDTPEAVGAALAATLDANWRPDATKVVILIADAPPHGLDRSGGDTFPNGEPGGADPFEVLRDMGQRSITVYSVVPGADRAAIAFFGAAAAQTNGKAVAMGSAAALADVVVGASLEEMDLEELLPRVKTLTEEIKRAEAGVDEATLQKRIHEKLTAEHVTARKTVVRSALDKRSASLVVGSATLAEARASYAAAPPPPPPRSAPLAASFRTSRSSSMLRMAAFEGTGVTTAGGMMTEEVAEADEAGAEVELAEAGALDDETFARVWRKGRARGDY